LALLEEEEDSQVVTNEPKPAFKTLVAVALDNAGIDTKDQLCAAQSMAEAEKAVAVPIAPNSPWLVEAYNDKIVYNITIELPDGSFIPANDEPAPLPIVMQHDVAPGAPTAAAPEVE
jgi:hypothetical protein